MIVKRAHELGLVVPAGQHVGIVPANRPQFDLVSNQHGYSPKDGERSILEIVSLPFWATRDQLPTFLSDPERRILYPLWNE
jgi:hypothetical protein